LGRLKLSFQSLKIVIGVGEKTIVIGEVFIFMPELGVKMEDLLFVEVSNLVESGEGGGLGCVGEA
jgi:hypothetical protein